MSHYCRLCGSHRANERFSGRGHRTNVCRYCQRLPKDERLAIEAGLDLDGFLFAQSHISKKNRERLRELCESPTPGIATLAAIVLQIATIAPYKKKRFRILRRVAPHLIQALVDQGLLKPLVPLEDLDEEAQIDGWIPEKPAGDEPPRSFEPVLGNDVPF